MCKNCVWLRNWRGGLDSRRAAYYNTQSKAKSSFFAGVSDTVFAIDAGNTNIVLGVFDGRGELCFTARILSDPLMTSDQYAGQIAAILDLYGVKRGSVGGSIISTVVPALVRSLSGAARLLFGVEPLIVGRGTDCGLKVKGLKPEDIGADLVCGAVGGIKKYGAPLVIFDFGTATTVSAIDKDGVFIGGSIIPGVMISLRALSSSAALLSDVSPEGEEVSPISLDTAECMRAGSLIGSACMMDGMISRFKERIGANAKVVATGGLAGLVVRYCRTEGIIKDDRLLLDGLYEIYKLNKGFYNI